MVEFKVLVPVASNEGRKFSVEHNRRFEARARELFGGWSKTGPVEGEWVDGDRVVYSDTSTEYRIAVPSVLDASRVREFIIFAAKHYAQKAMYFTVLGVTEVFTPNWRDGSTAQLGPEAFAA